MGHVTQPHILELLDQTDEKYQSIDDWESDYLPLGPPFCVTCSDCSVFNMWHMYQDNSHNNRSQMTYMSPSHRYYDVLWLENELHQKIRGNIVLLLDGSALGGGNIIGVICSPRNVFRGDGSHVDLIDILKPIMSQLITITS